MKKNHSYIVLGSGKQGVAAAYDFVLFGDASRVTLADSALSLARAGVGRIKKLAGPLLQERGIRLRAVAVNGKKKSDLLRVIRGHDAVLSALPYYLNPDAADAAIATKAHYADLGGYFETTQAILKLDAKAKKAGVTLIPDCGVSPGMCNSLAAAGMDLLSTVNEVKIYCGGLPQSPRPPLHYKIVFNLEGLLGNYFGKAYVLKNGKVGLMQSFSGREELEFDAPLGKLEAVVTGGATSTCPWTYQGKVQTYEYRTLRYPGHYDKIQLLKDLGLLDEEPVMVNGQPVSPRQLFVAAAGPKLSFPDDRDLLVQRVIVRGDKDGQALEIVYDVLDFYDPVTGFTAMQRTTGFSAAIVAALQAQGRVRGTGAVPLEKAVSGRLFLEEIRRRGVQVKETVRRAGALKPLPTFRQAV